MAVATHRPPVIDGPSAEAPSAGQVGARRGLPGGRAVVGGLLVAVAGLGTFAAAARAGDAPSGQVVVAARDVDPGTILGLDDVALATGAVPQTVAGRAFSRLDDVVGAVAVGPLSEGELVQAGALVDGVGGAVPTLSLALEPAAADGGALVRGDRVQVLATYGADASATTVAASTSAEVVAIDGGGDALGPGGQVLVRLAVASAEERSAIVHASVAGRVALVRTTGARRSAGIEPYRPSLPTAAGELDEPEAGGKR